MLSHRVVQPSDVERIYQSTIPTLGPLPAGWEMRISSDGRSYFLDHGAKTSTWDGIYYIADLYNYLL